MNATIKKVLYVIGGNCAALVLAAVIFTLTFDINYYKPRIEDAVSDATGLDVSIKGMMNFSFFPFGVSAKDIHITNNGSDILSLDNLKLGAELMPLLKKQLKVTSCEIVKPVITIVKHPDGKYNFESSEKKPDHVQPGAAFSLNELKLSKGLFVYLDEKTGEKTELKDFNLSIKGLTIKDTASEIIKNTSFTGNFDSKKVENNNLIIDNVKSDINAQKGVFYLMPITMDIFGGKAEGDVTADMSAADTAYKINLKVSKLDFEKLQESFGAKKVIGGKGDLDASITIKEKTDRNLMSGMDGSFSLRGENLIIYTMDLDKVLSKYETSQKVDLVDIGAFFIAGPLGNAALKGYRYGDVYVNAQGGKGAITQLISNWNIRDGAADAEDVALATQHNRLALKGRLDLVRERYEDVSVALLDDKGCAKFKQRISGPFDNPEIGAVSAVKSIAEPIFDLFRKAKSFVQGGRCDVFYNGAVLQP
ncbi:MAG: AsmA family protein [Nitrospirae bacterium]|nr:AsmA family protein [Nitrospirota bacterium]